MEPVICPEKQIILMGMSFYGDPFDTRTGWDEENHIGRLWKRFSAFLSRHPEVLELENQPDAAYEVHIYNPETTEKGLFEVFVGMEIRLSDVERIPAELSIKTLPLTEYAVFTFKGEQISSDWEKLIQDWLTSAGYHSPHMYNFQYYDARFKGLDNLADSVLDVYVPIQKAG